MRPISLSYALAAASANNIALSQTPAGAGALVLNGSTVVAGVAVLDAQRHVLITPAGNETGKTFVVTGIDANGMVVSESLAGTNATAIPTTINFKTVTSVTISAAAAGALTVGTNGVGESQAIPVDLYISPNNFQLAYELVSGAQNVDVQYTNDDPYAAAFLTNATVWTGVTGLTGKSANADGQVIFPCSAFRLKANSGAGTGKLIVRQAGGFGRA